MNTGDFLCDGASKRIGESRDGGAQMTPTGSGTTSIPVKRKKLWVELQRSFQIRQLFVNEYIRREEHMGAVIDWLDSEK